MKDAFFLALKIGGALIAEVVGASIFFVLRIIGGFLFFGLLAYGLLRLTMYLMGAHH